MQTGRSRAFRPGIECLESRSLMAAQLTATLSAGLLRVDGTAGADHIVVRQQDNQISVDNATINIRGQGHVSSVSASEVARIHVRGLEDKDIIEVGGEETSGANALLKPVWIWGGSGNDRIYGGQGDDKIHSDDGNDMVFGRGGNDTIDGDAGNDRIDGGSGNDKLRGGDGYDYLWGGSGHDWLEGGSGNDKLYGGSGNDSLDGGTGTNHLAGETGDDAIYSHGSRDTVDGGGGRDRTTFFTAAAPRSSTSAVQSAIRAVEDFNHPAVVRAAAPAAPFGAEESELIGLTNAYRRSYRLGELVFDSRLAAAAQSQADYMARTGHYAHDTLDGKTLGDRVRAARYSFSFLAENIHLYEPTVRRTYGIGRVYQIDELAQYYLDGWKVSPSHNANLLSPKVRQIGVGIAQDRNGRVYVSMVLGSP